jgi:dTDP-4-dehydrorhamnose reductase
MLDMDGGKFLVTGASGQLGYEVQRQLREVAQDNPGIQVVPKTREAMNILDSDAVYHWLKGARPDAVINCAGYTDVAGAEHNREDCWAANVCGTNILAMCASKLDIPLIHISTDFVFGQNRRRQPYTEAAPVAPLNHYGITKANGEHTLLRWAAIRPFPWWIIRCAGLFEKPWRHRSNFPMAIYQALQCRAQRHVDVVTDVETNLTYAPDLARVIIWLLRQRERVPSGIYHVTNQGTCRWYEVAAKIATRLGQRQKLRGITKEQFAYVQRRDATLMPRYTCLSQERYAKLGGPEMPPWQDAIDAWFSAKQGARKQIVA